MLNLIIHKSEENKIRLCFNDFTEQFHSFLALEESAWAIKVSLMPGDIQMRQACHLHVEKRCEEWVSLLLLTIRLF